jgi:hypothetical protein
MLVESFPVVVDFCRLRICFGFLVFRSIGITLQLHFIEKKVEVFYGEIKVLLKGNKKKQKSKKQAELTVFQSFAGK